MQPYIDCGTISLRNFFLDNEWDVMFLSPDQKHFYQGGKSVLLLPDTGGINANVSYFMREGRLPPDIPPQDQAMEYFRLNTLSWYLKKQEEQRETIGVLGIGYSGFLIFAEALGGSLMKDKSKLVYGHCEKDMDCNENYFHHVRNRIAGLLNPTHEEILRMANILVKKSDGGGQLITVPVPNPTLVTRL